MNMPMLYRFDRGVIAGLATIAASGVVPFRVVMVGLVVGAVLREFWGYVRGKLSAGVRSAFPREDWERRLKRAPWLAPFVAAFRPDLGCEVAGAAAAVERGGVRVLALAATGAVIRIALLALTAWCVAVVVGAASRAWPDAVRVGFMLMVAWGAVLLVDHATTWTGRRMLLARIGREVRFEFWPTWMVYAPLVPYWIWLGIRHRSLLAFTACNPGIPFGGGVVGESKSEIMLALQRGIEESRSAGGRSAVARTLVVDPGTDCEARAARVERLMREHGIEYPIIVKPDSGQRGHAVKKAASFGECRGYFRIMTGRAVVQPYHEGPGEVGVLWIRGENGTIGSIFSVTVKRFPEVRGDGVRSLEELVLSHPRFRLQHQTFLARHRSERSRVPRAGEVVRLGVAGNHCQGTLFKNGAHLITPELTAAIDRVARGFVPRSSGAENAGEGASATARWLDIGRFDIRFRSESELRAGLLDEGGIIEFNGTTGETTNIYDPEKSIVWAYGYLFRQWKELYRLGAARIAEGHRAMGAGELARAWWRARTMRSGSAVSD